MDGGLEAWDRAGLPLEPDGRACRGSLGRCCALALLALAGAGQRRGRLTLVPVGDFDSPIAAASPPRDSTRLFVVERGGRVWLVRNGTKLRDAFLDIVDQVATDGERGLLSIAFAPDYEASGPLLRLPDRRAAARRAAGARVPPLGARPRPRRPDRPDRVEHAARRGEQPQRRPDPVRARRAAVVRDRRRRRRQRSVQPRPRPREPPRQAAADRSDPRQRRRLHDPRRQPVRHRGLGATACATRSGSPSTSAGRATCSSATSARASARRSTGLPRRGPRAGRRLRVVVPRGDASRGRAPAAPARATWGRSGSTRSRPARGDRRLSRARPGPAVARRPLRLRGHLRGDRALLRARRPVADRRRGRPACRSATCSSPSPRTPAATST